MYNSVPIIKTTEIHFKFKLMLKWVNFIWYVNYISVKYYLKELSIVACRFKWSDLNALLHKIASTVFFTIVYVNHKHLCPCP